MNELEEIEGIGAKTKELLAKLKIYTINDLIEHYPFRYEILKRSDLSELKDGAKIIIDGVIEGQPTIIYINSKLKKIIFRINTGETILNISVYNKVYLMDSIKTGKVITVIGKYDKIKNAVVAIDIRMDSLPTVPKIESIYYTTAGLSKKCFCKYITSLRMSGYKPKDILPEYLLRKYELLSKYEAINEIHNPTDVLLLKKARQRIKYEELFLYLLKVNYLKDKRNKKDAIERKIDEAKIEKFIKKLPFELTTDQTIAVNEILDDLKSSKRMNRLLQGDVGSGKTIVALIAIYANYLAGYQSALMVPTEILANQHYNDTLKLFKGTKLKTALLTSSTKKKERNEILKGLADGSIGLVIGTQSLLNEEVVFDNLSLVVTDEQHRFGVNQRNIINNKNKGIDVLSMSATPIPRTYALTIYGDMDVSNIKTKPAGRKEVITYFKREKDITSVLELMKQELDNNHQIYVIAPMIDEDSDKEMENVADLEEKMNKAFSKIAKIEVIHGKLDSKEKDKIMKNYESGKTNILISTTVIEVGVNVPNASMIVIFDANVFGLATLHQLRGRVGRSDIQSYCVLIAKDVHERLKFMETTNDGFEVSEYDFKNRGEGDLFGVRQSGDVYLKLANFKRDYQMLLKARDDVLEFLPKLNQEEYPDLYDELTKLDHLA